VPYAFDPSVGRYRTLDGRFVRENAVLRALDAVLTGQAGSARALTQQMVDGTISVAAWQAGMMQQIKAAHLVGLATANGGWNQLDQSDFGWVGQRIRSQYAYLRDFAADVASSRQPLNGTVLSRAEMYVESGRATHRAAERRAARARGLDLERNRLGAADHCPGCLTETAKGWQPIGTLVPCGSRNCLSRCHCSLAYRRAA
jgi:hypothetical protein